jgi:hypothetical protein
MGKERLADPGYYVEITLYPDGRIEEYPDTTNYISPKQKCQWRRTGQCDWTTLLWSCAPTKKSCELITEKKPVQKHIRFSTIENINAKYGVSFPKSPLDKEST